jgi:SAM-dependent methyltransferase
MTAAAEPARDGAHDHGIAALLCPHPGRQAPAEFAFGWDRLRENFGAATLFVDTPARPGTDGGDGAPGTGDPGRCTAPPAGLPDDARVAWMPTAQAMVLPVVLARLARALDADPGLTAAIAHDQRYAPRRPPDYCTERGLERYLAALGEAPAAAVPFSGQAAPSLVLTTAGAMRRGSVWSKAAWVGDAYVHDYADYQRAARDEVMPLIPADVHRVLDVGGGEGRFLEHLRRVRAQTRAQAIETHLAEQSPEACAVARARVDRVWEGDFGSMPIDDGFDCICFLEALEHTTDPLHWLRRARELLAPGGSVVASVPNVGHWSVIADLLEGRWDTSPVGIHCVTHLRFFTGHGLRALFARAGLRIERIEHLRIACPPGWRATWLAAAGSPAHGDAGEGHGPVAGAMRLAPDADSWDSYAFIVRARADAEAWFEPRTGRG